MTSRCWSRRDFISLACAGLLAAASKSLPAENGLTLTDPGCAPDAYARLMEFFRSQRAEQKPISDQQRLRDGRAWLAGQPVEDLREGETSCWVEIPGKGPAPNVKLRVLRPAAPPAGVVLAIHGGGWALGSALSDEKRNWEWARHAGVVVVSPDYRLAPESPFPAGPDDCEAAARWLISESQAIFGTSKLALSGGSAGGHLAALTLQRLEPSLRQAFSCAVLYYGVYDLGRSEVWREARDSDFPDLAPSEMNLFLDWFLPGLTDDARRNPRYSPLHGELTAMPPALFLVGGADLLLSDTRLMAKRWAQHGHLAELVEYPGAPHGFNGFDVACGLDADRYAAEYTARHLAG